MSNDALKNRRLPALCVSSYINLDRRAPHHYHTILQLAHITSSDPSWPPVAFCSNKIRTPLKTAPASGGDGFNAPGPALSSTGTFSLCSELTASLPAIATRALMRPREARFAAAAEGTGCACDEKEELLLSSEWKNIDRKEWERGLTIVDSLFWGRAIEPRVCPCGGRQGWTGLRDGCEVAYPMG